VKSRFLSFITGRQHAKELLRRSEEKYRSMVENAIEAICISQDGYLRFVNPAMMRLTRRSLDELTTRPFLEFVHPDDRAMVLEKYRRRLQGLELPQRNTFRCLTGDGEMRSVEVDGGVIDWEGNPAILNFFIDITDRLRTEEALRESEDHYRDLVHHSQDLMCTHDLDGRVLSANPAAVRASGYELSEILGMNLRDVLAPEVRDQFSSYLAEIREEGVASGLVLVQTKTREKRIWEFENSLRTEGLGKPIVRGIAHDITERKRAVEALRESELHFRTLAETTDLGILIMQDEHYIYANPAAERATGYTARELAGMSFLEVVHPDFRELVHQRAAARLAGGHDLPSRYEIKSIVKGGAERWFSLSSGATVLGGKPALVASITDVTAERRLRDQQTALYEISEATQTAGTLEDLYRSIHAIIGRLMNAKNLYIALYDPTTNLIWFPYFVDEVDTTPEPFPFGRGMTSYVMRSGRPLLATPGVLSELEARGEIERLGAASIDWLGVPLKVQDRIIGVLAVQSYVGNVRYNEADQEVLSYVSAQVAQAIERKRAEDELRSSEARFRSYFELPLLGIAMSSTDKRWLQVNDRLCSILGYSRDELLKMTWSEMTHPEDVEVNVRLFDRVLSGEIDHYNLEKRFIRKDGTVFWTSLAAGCVRKPDGSVDYLVVLVEDITEQKRADHLQAAMYEISKAAQQAVSLNDLFAAVHRIVGRLMEARNFYIALYDSTTNLLSFPYFIDEIDECPDPFSAERGMTSHVVHTGRPLLATPEVLKNLEDRGEIQSLGADSIDWLGVPLKVQDKIIGVLAVQTYVGSVRYSEADQEVLSYVSAQVAQAIERKQAEEALRENEERFRGAFDDAATGMALVGLDGRLLRVNRALCEIVGFAEAELLTKAFQDITHPDDLARDLNAWPKLLTGEIRAYEMEKRYIHKDGHVVWAHLSVSLVRDSAGRPLYFVSHLNDLTDRKHLEEQLLQAQKMEAVGRLAGGVAHDFNNVLQSMLSHVQLLRTLGADPVRSTSIAAELEQQIKRASALTRQLLVFSRQESTRPEHLDLNEVISQASGMLRPLVRENIAFSLQLADGSLVLEADRGQLNQVLMNLVVNASDAMPTGGTITLRTGREGENVWLEIEDTGHGIPAEILPHIFEPFFTTKAAGQSTGLGLSVVHGIVTTHRGQVDVHSAVGAGTTMRILFPSAAPGSAPVSPAFEFPGDVPRGKGERVLLVEDEQSARVSPAK
jgi:PAS domain S-box-containing protein